MATPFGAGMTTGFPVAPMASPFQGAPLHPRSHSVQFYDDDAFLLDGLSRFLGSALGGGDAVVVIATQAHRAGIAKRLKARGIDLQLAEEEGRYVSLDAAETLARFMVEGQPDPDGFERVVGRLIECASQAVGGKHPRIAAFGEMVALLWAEGKKEAAIKLEELWNHLAEKHTFALHCAYPMHLFERADDTEAIGQICSSHSHVVPAESYTALATDHERLAAIALLQQKARALETEVVEHREARKSLDQRNKELTDALASRNQFLTVAAHELKTPITGLRGFAQLLLRDMNKDRQLSPERLARALDAIDVQSAKLGRLVARLLDTAQIDAGKLRIEPARVDIVSLAQGVLEEWTVASHQFIFYGPDHLEATIDPMLFEQVIANLVDNAVKFSPLGGTIEVAAGQVGPGQDNAGGIWLSVTDQGIGIPPEQREEIFNRFHQAHGEDHRSGLGLGLFIAREIVQLHGGSIQIEEGQSSGSRFVVTLPPVASPGANCT